MRKDAGMRIDDIEDPKVRRKVQKAYRDQHGEELDKITGAPVAREHKYGARSATDALFPELAGRRFDSQLERDRARELVMLERAGEISGLRFQVSVQLSEADIRYRADFAYLENGRLVYEDTKGMQTKRWRIIKKLWRKYGPALLRITVRGRYGIMVKDQIMPDLTDDDVNRMDEYQHGDNT
jgi:hypothetical protein